MNKSAIALSVVAALAASAAAQAETTFYGRISTAIGYIDPDDGDDVWDLVDSGSRFGVRGTEDLGNGLSAVYQLEIDIKHQFGNGKRFREIAGIGHLERDRDNRTIRFVHG